MHVIRRYNDFRSLRVDYFLLLRSLPSLPHFWLSVAQCHLGIPRSWLGQIIGERQLDRILVVDIGIREHDVQLYSQRGVLDDEKGDIPLPEISLWSRGSKSKRRGKSRRC